MIDAAADAFGDLHVVVNNAGIDNHAALETITEDQFDSVIAVNLKGTFAVSRWAAHYWRAQVDQHGSNVDRVIINTASESGLTQPLPLQSNYAASKAGVGAMTIVHALELSRLGVRVNCLVPSMIRPHQPGFCPWFFGRTSGGAVRSARPDTDRCGGRLPGERRLPDDRPILDGSRRHRHAIGGWAPDGQVQRGDRAWTVADLAPELEALPRPDVMAGLMSFFEEAVGPAELQVLVDYANTYFQQSPSE